MKRLLGSLKFDAEKKRLLGNFISLSILQGANYILPLITLPYLVRVLGPEKFGLVAFAQAFIQYFNVLADYGFSLSATREISIHRDDREKVSEIFSSVMIIKFFLLVVSLVVLSVIVFSFEKFRKDWLVYYLTFGTVIGQAMFPVWFFQGLEEMRYITFLNIIAKSIFVFLIFIFVRKEFDYIYVPLFNSFGTLFSAVLANFFIFRNLGVSFNFPKYSVIISYFIYSTPFFLSRIFVSIYTASNTFIVGLVMGNKIVGFYAAAEKLFYAIVSWCQPVVGILYPYVSKTKNLSLFKRVFYVSNVVNLLLWVLVFAFSQQIVGLIYGKEFVFSAALLKLFSVAGVISVPAILLGYPFLGALGYHNYANYSVIVASFFHLVLLTLFVLTSMTKVEYVVITLIVSQLILLITRTYAVRKFKLWSL